MASKQRRELLNSFYVSRSGGGLFTYVRCDLNDLDYGFCSIIGWQSSAFEWKCTCG